MAKTLMEEFEIKDIKQEQNILNDFDIFGDKALLDKLRTKIIENIIKGIILLLDSKLAKSTTVIALTIWSNTLTFSIVSVVKVILTPLAISTSDIPSIINTEDIKLVIINTINTYLSILPSLFKSSIFAILDDIVKNTSGTTIVYIKFKKISPNGFK